MCCFWTLARISTKRCSHCKTTKHYKTFSDSEGSRLEEDFASQTVQTSTKVFIFYIIIFFNVLYFYVLTFKIIIFFRGVPWRRTSPQQLFKLYQRFLDFILYFLYFYISIFQIFKLYFLGESLGGRLRLNNCSNHTKGFSKQVSSNCMYTRAMFCANYTPHVITHEWQKFSLVKLETESRYDCY